MKSISVMVIAFFLAGPLLAAGESVHLYGADFSTAVNRHGQQVILQGVGQKRYFLIKAFVAGFYLAEDNSFDNPLSNVPKRLEVVYFCKVNGQKLADYTRKKIEENIGTKTFERIQKDMAVMDGYWKDLKPGDHYIIHYDPQIGTEFILNDKTLGIIQNQVLAQGLFAVWIGKEPMDDKLKASILDKEYLSSLLS